MSIALCVVDKNRRFYMASDLRAIRGGVVRDDYQKVFELKPRVYFGMTGIAEAGLAVLEQLRASTNLSVAELISKAGEIVVLNCTKLTIMLAGQDEDGQFFIWQKNNVGDIAIADVNDSNIAYSVAAPDKIGEFENHFRRAITSGASIDQAISITIRFASTIESTISPAYKTIKLERT